MKTRVTMKVKHLVMILIGVFIVLPLSSMFLLPQIELVIAKHHIANGELKGKGQIFAVLNDNILPSQKYRIIQNYFLQDDGLDNYDIYIGPGSTSSYIDAESVHFSWEEKLPYLEDYLENGPADYNLVTATRHLAGDAAHKGDFERVEAIYDLALERFKNRKDDFNQYELYLSRVHQLIRGNELALAEKHLKETFIKVPEEQSYYQAEAAKYYAEIKILQGKKLEALAEVQKALEEYEANWKKEENSEPIEQVVVYEQLKRMENQLTNISDIFAGEVTTVSGKVTGEDGAPIADAGIYLRQGEQIHRSISRDEAYQVRTDENGNYEINNVIPGNYQLYAGFMFDDIDGHTWPVDVNDWITVDGTEDISYDVTLAPLMEVKSPANDDVITEDEVHFVWEEIEEASYYTLQFHVKEENVSYPFGLDMRFNEAEAILPVEILYNLPSNIILSKEEAEEDYFNPATFLGFENPDGKFSWNVQAYDENGKLLTRSDGYRLNEGTIGNLPIISFKTRKLTAEDELLLDSNLEVALAGYKENVESNPKDAHSLRIITKLIGIEGDGTWKTFETLQNPYMEKLAKLTNDSLYIFQVMNYYLEQKSWNEYQDWYEFYMEVQGDAIDSYAKAIHANAQMYQGNYEEAAALHKEALSEGNDHQFIGNLLALEIYQGTAIDEVLDLAKKYPYFEYDYDNGSSDDWKVLLIHVQRELQDDPTAVEELNEGIELYFKDETDKLEAWKESTKSSSLTKFINALESQ